jgi:Flp pilus assembly protein CpaB
MNRRVLILLLLIVVIIVIGAVVFLQQPAPPPVTTVTGQAPVQGGPTATPIPVARIVVAIQQIPRGMKIPREGAVDFRPWPRDAIPSDAITDPAEVVGKIARTDIFVEQPIVRNLLVDNLADIAEKGSDAAAMVPQGQRAISLPMDRLTGLAYGIQDGDYVDVIVSFLFVDVDPNFQSLKPNKVSIITIAQDGTVQFSPPIQGELQPSNFTPGPVLISPTEIQRPRLVTQTTIQGAFVIHVGTFPLDGKFIGRPVAPPTPTEADNAPTKAAPPPTPTPTVPDIITIAVSPQDAVVLSWAIEAQIPMTLTLRSVKDKGAPSNQTTAVTLQYMIENYQVAQPPALPYALEPALRSIRRIVIGNEVSLSGQPPK